MKILYLIPKTNSYLSKWQNYHFINELKKLGINFTVFEMPKENISNFSYDKLIKKFQKKILTYCYPLWMILTFQKIQNY